MNPSQTLRELAGIATNPIVKERLMQLAAELELQHNGQNNTWAIALGRAQNTWEEGLTDLRRDILATIETSNTDIIGRLDALLTRLEGNHQGSAGRG